MTTNDTTDFNAERMPIVQIIGGEAMADSRDVSAYFGKQHKDVLRSIRDTHCSEDFRQRNFAPFYIKDLTGETTSHVMMTKDGLAFAAFGFTGATAGRFKEKYIGAFNAMEAELRSRAAEKGTYNVRPPEIDVRDISQLSVIALQLIDVNKELTDRVEIAERAVEEAKPKTSFFDRFVNAEGLFGLQNAGRCLLQGPNKFVSYLKRGFLFYQGGSLVPRAQYRDAGLFEVKPYIDDTGKARYQTFVTAKGIEYFARKLGVTPIGGAA